MSNIQLIAAREFKLRVTKPAFAITTGIMCLIVVLGAFLPVIIAVISSNQQTKLAIVNQTGSATIAGQNVQTFFNTALATQYDATGKPIAPDPTKKPAYQVNYAAPSELEALRDQVRNDKLDGVLAINRKGDELSFEYLTKNGSTDTSTQSVRQAATILTISDRVARLNISQAQETALATPATINVTTTQGEKNKEKGRSDAEIAANYFLVFALIIALFTTIQSYGAIIAQGVVEEKSSRIMEILINAATPTQLMFGKIIGIGLVGLLQFAIIGVFAVAGFLSSGPVSDALLGTSNGSISLNGIGLSIVLYFVAFFILAYFLYAGLYAAIGSLCSRTEDVQQAIMPLVFLNMIGYFAAIFGLQAINSTWVAILSYVPFFSPILMFARIGIGTVSPVEVIIAFALLFFSMILMTWLAARVYRAGVLMYGKRPGTRQLISMMLKPAASYK
jgi:ABC-2 type transport system permease protein